MRTSKQKLICCICGAQMEVDVFAPYAGFDKAVCGKTCFYEKRWRETLSIMGLEYKSQSEAFRKEHQ